MNAPKKYSTFKSFYPFYLSQHMDFTNRLLHFCGTALLLSCLVTGLATGIWWLFAIIPVLGYGFAWVGHFFIEKNKPATFTYPVYSLASDFVMFWHTITGQLKDKLRHAKTLYSDNNLNQ